jgi:hypothetical protein
MAINEIIRPIFQPAMRTILAIVKGFPTRIETDIPNQYKVGIIVRINIPPNFGMFQINQMTGTILSIISPTRFSIDIDSTNFDSFVEPPENPGHNYTPAYVTPFGEVNSTLYQATRNILPF